MKAKRFLSLLLALVVFAGNLSMTAIATGPEYLKAEESVMRAMGRFNMDVPGKTMMRASTSFPLEAGETVTIKASYTPFSASVDFGLIASDGYFYYVNTKDGSFDQAIKVKNRGNYTLAVQNNSSEEVNVSGYVNY